MMKKNKNDLFVRNNGSNSKKEKEEEEDNDVQE